MKLYETFLDWCRKFGNKEAAKEFRTYPSVVQRWLNGSHEVSTRVLGEFFDKYISKDYCDVQNLHRKPAEWEGRALSICVPCYKLTNPASAWSWVALALDLGKEKVRMDMENGDAIIENARNKLAWRFLQSECEWSLWLDDDVIAPIGRPEWFKYMAGTPPDYPDELAGEHVAHRLMSHGKKIIGGLYFGRQKTGVPMFYEGLAVREVHLMARDDNQRGILETDWIGTGCLLVHRSVFEDIMEKFPERRMTDIQIIRNVGEFDFFRKETGGGEDVAFCHLAQKAGHKVYVDLGLRCAHVGFCPWGSWNTSNGVK